MQGPQGGRRRALPMAAVLLIGVLLAGCIDAQDDEIEIGEGEGLVTIWMTRPANAAEYDVQVLQAVPRFISFKPADEATILATNSTGYVDLATGWTKKEGGWEEGQWPRSAEKDWLILHDVWYRQTVPAGNYSEIRIEIIDQYMVMWNAAPRLFIGTPYESTGHPRLTFKPDPEVGVFQVTEGEELVLNFQTTLELQGGGKVLIY